MKPSEITHYNHLLKDRLKFIEEVRKARTSVDSAIYIHTSTGDKIGIPHYMRFEIFNYIIAEAVDSKDRIADRLEKLTNKEQL